MESILSHVGEFNTAIVDFYFFYPCFTVPPTVQKFDDTFGLDFENSSSIPSSIEPPPPYKVKRSEEEALAC